MTYAIRTLVVAIFLLLPLFSGTALAKDKEKEFPTLLKATGPVDHNRNEYTLAERIVHSLRISEEHGKIVIKEDNGIWIPISGETVEIEIVPKEISVTLSCSELGSLRAVFAGDMKTKRENIVLYFTVADVPVNYYAVNEQRQTATRESVLNAWIQLNADFDPSDRNLHLNPNTEHHLVEYLAQERARLAANILEAVTENKPVRFSGRLTLEQTTFDSLEELREKGLRWHLEVKGQFSSGVLIGDRWQ